MLYAVSATLTKVIPNGRNIQSVLNIFEASSAEEAVGFFINWSSDSFPEHDIHIRPLVVPVSDAPLNTKEPKTHSANTGYMAAVWKELRKRQGGPLPLKQNWIYVTEARLNAALKAAQHCM